MNRTRGQLLVVLSASALVMCSALGCRPAPTPLPPTRQVVHTPPPTPAPTYTEEWQNVPIRINYPTGGSRLDDQARAMMREVHASVAHRTDIVRVSVEGHADSRGTSEQNHMLGMERAQGVVDFLVGELRMPRELFEIHSFGDTRPLSSNTTGPDRLLNRRVEFRMLVRRQAAYH